MKPARLARVMTVANSSPHEAVRERWYALKSVLCRIYGDRSGHDIQVINDACWGDYYYGCDENCGKCGGTGVYRQRRFILQRWTVGGRVFHEPIGRWFNSLPEPNIVGRIEHRRRRTGLIAAAALGYLFDRELYWQSLQAIDGNRFGRAVRRAEDIARGIAVPTKVAHYGIYRDCSPEVQTFVNVSRSRHH